MKNKKKIIKISLIVIAIIVLMIAIFGIVDYLRAINGKKPIFIYHSTNVSNFDVEMAGFEDTTLSKPDGAYYYGVGYIVSTCDVENGNYSFQLGHKEKPCSTSLSCTKTFAENDTHSFDYEFYDDKLVLMTTTLTIPVEQIADEETYEKEFMKVSDVTGCGAFFTKLNETTYKTTQICNIAKMSNDDIKAVYMINREDLEQTREEIIKGYNHDNGMICR